MQLCNLIHIRMVHKIGYVDDDHPHYYTVHTYEDDDIRSDDFKHA